MTSRKMILIGVLGLFGATLGAILSTTSPAHAGNSHLTIHNSTGTDVDVVIFEDGKVHRNPKDAGVHAGHIKDGESATGDVKTCKFAVVLFHDKDVYAHVFTDCTVTDITISKSDRQLRTSGRGRGEATLPAASGPFQRGDPPLVIPRTPRLSSRDLVPRQRLRPRNAAPDEQRLPSNSPRTRRSSASPRLRHSRPRMISARPASTRSTATARR